MIYGIGVDMATISRVADACEGERFLTKYYSQRELEEYAQKPEKLAANFSVKEAFSKALGTGVRGFSLREITVLRDELGKPYCEFSGKAKSIIEEKKLICHVSITDEGDYVVAFCVLETE